MNPRSHVQVYFPMGFDWSWASVEGTYSSTSAWTSSTQHYSYFGGHLGVGLEFRISKHFALNAALIGFYRGRVDDIGPNDYEFVDPNTGRRTNTSGGGLLQAGMTVYF